MLNYASIPEIVVNRLVGEAHEKLQTKVEIRSDFFSVDDDGKLRSKRRMSMSTPGKMLEKAHKDTVLKAISSFYPEQTLFPTRASYLFYGTDDYLLIHNDLPQCAIVALLTLKGDDPLVVYPFFGECSPQDILNLNNAPIRSRAEFEGYLASEFKERVIGEQVKALENTALSFQSRELAHARFPQTEPAIVCAFCYVPIYT